MEEELDAQEQANIEALLCELKALQKNGCSICGAVICGHEALMSLTMGFKDAPKCCSCLAGGMAFEREALRDHILNHIRNRLCFHEGWMWANREEGFEPDEHPGCLWSVDSADSSGLPQSLSESRGTMMLDSDSSHYDAEWDAGDMACGDLVLELRLRLQAVDAGQVLKVVARDSGAEKDLPAWCRMTGHTLVDSRHPVYFIKRKTV
jgi:tRNA 2-thiouridine synthesizing protein A